MVMKKSLFILLAALAGSFSYDAQAVRRAKVSPQEVLQRRQAAVDRWSDVVAAFDKAGYVKTKPQNVAWAQGNLKRSQGRLTRFQKGEYRGGRKAGATAGSALAVKRTTQRKSMSTRGGKTVTSRTTRSARSTKVNKKGPRRGLFSRTK
jgi:hypothetical protein